MNLADEVFRQLVALNTVAAKAYRAPPAPFDRPDLFRSSERHGSGRLYFIQPCLTASQMFEARDVARAANPFATIQWYDDSALLVWGLE